MTATKAVKPRKAAVAAKRKPSWTASAIRNLHCAIFTTCALLSAYLAYGSISSGPKPGEPAPLWPYAATLLALGLCGMLISACVYMDDRSDGIGWLLGCDCFLGFVHLWVWLGYALAYTSDEDPHPYPSIWLCCLAVCACVNVVICWLFMPTNDDEHEARTKTLCAHDEEAAMLGAGSS
ncbi:hypothetical protein LTS10_002469 [Elasticomyces elasticus]|nr:hypothetical protein LTS10_002469 [Elasticomyces elasticus]